MAMWKELECRLWHRLSFELKNKIDYGVRDDAWADLRSTTRSELEGGNDEA